MERVGSLAVVAAAAAESTYYCLPFSSVPFHIPFLVSVYYFSMVASHEGLMIVCNKQNTYEVDEWALKIIL